MAKKRILVVDDDLAICDLVRTTLELDGFRVSEAHHVIEAERLIEANVPDAILLDIGLPGIDGLFYCERLREAPKTRLVPIIVISGSTDSQARAAAAGATSFLRKPLDVLELLTVLERATGSAGDAHVPVGPAIAQREKIQRLAEIGKRQHELQQDAHRQTLFGLSAALDSRDFGATGHSERVRAYAMRLALEVEPALTDDPSLEWGFLLHDLGMITIADRIITKSGRLDPDEREEMQRHALVGEQLLSSLPLLQGEGLRVVRSHHERWDGAGYPDRLAGTEISPGARILAVVDALDAMTDQRPYREVVSWDAAIEELSRQSGAQFDPDVIDGLVACEPELRAIRAGRLQLVESATG
ncbi:MAG TPA: HD domain-containing phosphohydrolase [Gaiellaceae bacterium]|jgi:response regulator RpfG family c-di-GMP phosphodiesterase|nr:HD domain-containing phosphohydrolase [Gaiellaceae bacterium]